MKELKESNLVAICHDQVIKPAEEQDRDKLLSLKKPPRVKESNRRIEEAMKKVKKQDIMSKSLHQSLCNTDRVDDMFEKSVNPEDKKFEALSFKR